MTENAVLYSKENCQWCDRARMLLDNLDIDYLEYKYEKDFTKEQDRFVMLEG